MIGALVQLSAYGTQNLYLNSNPQINYFSSVYRRYSNFAIENNRIDFTGTNNLTDTSNTTFTFNIKRIGDLLGNIFLVIDIPSIYSDDKYKFMWIKNLGSQIIESATLYFDSQKIQEIRGDTIHIYHRLKCDYPKNLTYNNMIGHIPNIYNPTNFNQTTYKIGVKRLTPPSIEGNKLYIPLCFYFTEISGLYLPLIALQRTEISIQVEIRNLNSWYTIIDLDPLSKTYNKRIRPKNNVSILDFTLANNFKTAFDIYIDATYIFLDSDIRTMFSANTHNYLIIQNQFTNDKNISGKFTSEIRFSNLIREYYFYLQKTTTNITNTWSNNTNFDDIDQNYLYGDLDRFIYMDALSINDIRNQYIDGSINLLDNILVSALIRFNDSDRTLELDQKYYRDIQTYQHHKGTNNYNFDTIDYIYNYNFGLEPDIFQPTGACNHTALKRVQLIVNTTNPPINRNFTIIYSNIITNNLKFNVYYRNVYYLNSINNNTDYVFNNNLIITCFTNGKLYGKINNMNMYIKDFTIYYTKYGTILDNIFLLNGGKIVECDNDWNILSSSDIIEGIIEFTYTKTITQYNYNISYFLLNTTDSVNNININNLNDSDFKILLDQFSDLNKYVDVQSLNVSNIIRTIFSPVATNIFSILSIIIVSVDKVNNKLYVQIIANDSIGNYYGIILYDQLIIKQNLQLDTYYIIDLSKSKFVLKNSKNMDFQTELTIVSPSIIAFKVDISQSIQNNMWNYDLNIIGVNYNLLEVMNGQASTKYAN